MVWWWGGVAVRRRQWSGLWLGPTLRRCCARRRPVLALRAGGGRGRGFSPGQQKQAEGSGTGDITRVIDDWNTNRDSNGVRSRVPPGCLQGFGPHAGPTQLGRTKARGRATTLHRAGQMPLRGRLRDCAGRDGADTICGDIVCERKQSKRGLVKIATKDGTEVCGQRIRERDSQDGLRAARLPTQAAQGGRAFLFIERERERWRGVSVFFWVPLFSGFTGSQRKTTHARAVFPCFFDKPKTIAQKDLPQKSAIFARTTVTPTFGVSQRSGRAPGARRCWCPALGLRSAAARAGGKGHRVPAELGGPAAAATVFRIRWGELCG